MYDNFDNELFWNKNTPTSSSFFSYFVFQSLITFLYVETTFFQKTVFIIFPKKIITTTLPPEKVVVRPS